MEEWRPNHHQYYIDGAHHGRSDEKPIEHLTERFGKAHALKAPIDDKVENSEYDEPNNCLNDCCDHKPNIDGLWIKPK